MSWLPQSLPDPVNISPARLPKGHLEDVSALAGRLPRLSSIGYESNGNDNSIKLVETELLDTILEEDLEGLEKLFTDSTSGIAVRLENYIEELTGDEGSLIKKQDSLTKQSGEITNLVAENERIVQSSRTRLINSFVAMERAQANVNQQLQFLSKRFP